MGRTGRKRKGKCILLLTEAEEKKFASAKETYARIQGQISRGGLLTYYKPDPVILPPNYKPTICRKMVTVGTYQPKITSARKRKRDIIEDPNYGRDGLLKPEAERNFVRSFCDRDHNFTNMEQVMTRYWPIQKTLLCLNKYVPLQARARSTFRVGHSSRTSQLVNLVQKCEHRILHPEEKIDFQLEPRKKQQTKLNLPQKAAATKKAQERGRRKTSSALDDADFADFIENNDVSRFIDTEEFTTENITDFFLPTKKKPVTGAPQPSVSLSKAPHVKNQEKDQEKDKGKSKIIPSKELHKEEGDTLFDDFGEGFEDEDREPSWEPILPDSFDENIVPLTDTRQQKKAESSTCVSNKQAQSTIYDAFMDINQNTSNLITLPSSITSALQPPASAQQLRVSVQQPHQTASNDMDQDSDEFFDFPMDDSFIAQAEALIVSNKLSCFSDVLEPVFPFERSINAQRTEAIAFVWAHTVPKFSDKAMKLLEKRQMDIKEMTGHFVLMNLFPQFKSSKQKSNAIIELDQKEDDDFSSMDGIIEQAALVEHQVVQHRASPHQEHEVISIDESQPLLDDNDAASATVSAANKGHEEDDDFDFDISEGVWANFIENKCEENDEPQGFPYSMFDPEPSPSKPPQIMSKSFLYADKPSTTANIEEDDDDQSFEYIFSQESSSSQKVIEEQDITEPKQAEQNELEPEQEVKAELDKLESVQEDQENRHAHELVKKEDSSGVNQKENYQSQSSDSDKDTLLLELDVEDFLRNDSGLLDAIKENGVSKAVEEEQEIDSIDKLIVMNDKNELEMDQYATVIKQAQEIQEKHDDAVETETIDQDHHSIISIQSNITDESPVVQFRSIKKTKAIISEDEQEETPETSPNRNLQSPSLLNQLSKGLYTPSPLRIQSSDNDESPIQLFRKRKSIRTIQDDEEDEVVLVYEQRESRKRRLKRKSTTPTLHHNNSTIFEIAEEEEEEELLLAPPSKNNLMNRLKQSSYGVHRQKRTSHRHYSQDTLENPFIDAEAEKSSDEGHTDDDIDEDQGSSCMNSFIDDNSSLGHMESSHVDEDEDDLLQFRKKSINIYAESLYKDDNPRHEKHWLNKFNADKWLDQGNEDEDEIIGDTDEESIQDFSSDLHHLAQNNNNGDILDDDFM
jgi:hypothetical protein